MTSARCALRSMTRTSSGICNSSFAAAGWRRDTISPFGCHRRPRRRLRHGAVVGVDGRCQDSCQFGICQHFGGTTPGLVIEYLTKWASAVPTPFSPSFVAMRRALAMLRFLAIRMPCSGRQA